MVPKDDMIQALRERFGEHAMDAPAGAWDAISSQLALGAAATTDLFAEFFRDRFQAHEAEVDPGVWDAIQNSLSNAPADSVNELFRNRFQGHEVEVPAGAWEAIGSQLGQGVAAGTGLSAGWLAASLAGLAGIGVLVWQLGSTEPVVTTTQPKDTFEQAVAPATTEVRADRSAAAQEISSDAIKNPVPAEVPSLGAPGAHQVAAVRSTSAPETGSSVTVTNEVLVPTANEVVPAMAEPAAPERMIPNRAVPAPQRGRAPSGAAVMEEMTRPQEATAHPVEPEMAIGTTEIEEEDHAAIHLSLSTFLYRTSSHRTVMERTNSGAHGQRLSTRDGACLQFCERQLGVQFQRPSPMGRVGQNRTTPVPPATIAMPLNWSTPRAFTDPHRRPYAPPLTPP
ncbi:MAG: hypothetical protein IPI41_00155 [Flavobacteriales bacterium]|nr:hypothetical protein [Flavobacteriales bacterium]